ncbi:protein-L-isoaspartate(D-aspartate) O-methyltransferase [Haoranjiania flava]|uniref:Protein-L-isoaspartate O-methyltransferase n=1 Tax=Haoranjiania flava TaxID=1856322 RepID=A0AAE3LKZ5_9BACT|nr:protein-L-isoaspartate(D-aspartate) O-methyltransferase [Haoranjiania flava]MCU7695098.1 protein-L-isoaspartate(D-aspartate) O-methyltransferase [Haoranjiania flava]
MRKFEDTYLHKGLRKKLVAQLKEQGIKDQRVLDVINNIPRHFFLDSAFDKIAYENRPFPIGEGQTISQPYTVAYQTELLNVQQGDKILEVGTGSVYQALVLAQLGAEVHTIERQKKLFDAQEKKRKRQEFFNHPDIHFYLGDGYLGVPEEAPFDKIIITAAPPFIPEKLMAQLRIGGVMVAPVQDADERQIMMRITKNDDGTWEEERFEEFVFVPMLMNINH